jgi:hypothetical protein
VNFKHKKKKVETLYPISSLVSIPTKLDPHVETKMNFIT